MSDKIPELGNENLEALHINIVGSSTASIEHPQRNEDSIFFNKKSFGTFDGLSKSADGKEASNTAQTIVEEKLSQADPQSTADAEKIVRESLEFANKVVKEKGNGVNETTANVGLIFLDKTDNKLKITIGNVGDSRFYLLRNKVLTPTLDQGLLKERIVDDRPSEKSLEEALAEAKELQTKLNNTTKISDLNPLEQSLFKMRNIVKNSLGRRDNMGVDTQTLTLEPGDILMCCSDGLPDNLTDEEIKKILENNNAGDAVKILIDKANERSQTNHFRAKPDDISVIVGQVSS